MNFIVGLFKVLRNLRALSIALGRVLIELSCLSDLVKASIKLETIVLDFF
jgi:hypothetical protein